MYSPGFNFLRKPKFRFYIMAGKSQVESKLKNTVLLLEVRKLSKWSSSLLFLILSTPGAQGYKGF